MRVRRCGLPRYPVGSALGVPACRAGVGKQMVHYVGAYSGPDDFPGLISNACPSSSPCCLQSLRVALPSSLHAGEVVAPAPSAVGRGRPRSLQEASQLVVPQAYEMKWFGMSSRSHASIEMLLSTRLARHARMCIAASTGRRTRRCIYYLHVCMRVQVPAAARCNSFC